jgi:hypothetical protein
MEEPKFERWRGEGCNVQTLCKMVMGLYVTCGTLQERKKGTREGVLWVGGPNNVASKFQTGANKKPI